MTHYSTLPRLSHVAGRLESRGLVERFPCPQDGRATNVRLTGAGWDAVVAAPGHVNTVRRNVLDPLTAEQLAQLRGIGDALLTRRDPAGQMTALYNPDHSQETPHVSQTMRAVVLSCRCSTSRPDTRSAPPEPIPLSRDGLRLSEQAHNFIPLDCQIPD